MANIINNITHNIISAKRDKAIARVYFNENYLSVAQSELQEKSDLIIQKQGYKLKRSLIKLEKKAASQKDIEKYKMQKCLENLNSKQRLPRLAAEQTYKRKLKKNGEDKADEYKKTALAKLDGKVEKITSDWTKRVNEASAQKDNDAAAQYENQVEVVKQKLNEFEKQRRQKDKEKLEKLREKTKKTTQKLNTKISEYDKKFEYLNKDAKSGIENGKTILEIKDLVMQFDGLKAVNELSFEVKENEIFGLIGPNGAGKTTVFNCITQFNKLTSGEIYYRSKSGEIIDVTKKRVHDIVKLGIVRTFQNLELIWELTVLENMLIGAHSLYDASLFDHILHTGKLRREEKIMKAKALEVLERLNLLAYKDVIPYGLPYGILKRIELARTLMVNPRLIILDEPAAGLNEAETEELAETIEKIRNDYNCTIFLVEHDMGLVMDICDTICAISFGKKLAMGTPNEIQNNAVVQEAYLGGTMTEDEDE